MVSFDKVSEPFWIHRSHRLRQVTIDSWVFQIECLAFVIRDDPRENRILRHVLGAALRVRVHNREVLEVGYLAVRPLLRILDDGGAFGAGLAGQVLLDFVVDGVALLFRLEV